MIDEALCIGANDQNSRLIICAYFKKDKPDNARFLAEHYGENGAGFYWMADSMPSGTMPRESALPRAKAPSVPAPRSSLGNRRRPVSENCWTWAGICLRASWTGWTSTSASNGPRNYGISGQDFAEGTADAGYLPTVNAIYGKNRGFPEESAAISDLLGHSEGLQNLRDELEQFVTAYGENRELLRFHFHRPQKLLEQLSDLQREPLYFTAAEGYDPQRRFFISGDEIDNLLRGGKRSTDYRLAVYSFYRNHTERKERENFLKHYHGEYSGHSVE